MVRVELEDVIREAGAFLERTKPPADYTLSLWFDDLKNIPSECLPYLRNRVRELDAWPRNFPKYIWACFKEWLEVHPDKRQQEKLGCPECEDGKILYSCKRGVMSSTTLFAGVPNAMVGLAPFQQGHVFNSSRPGRVNHLGRLDLIIIVFFQILYYLMVCLNRLIMETWGNRL